LHLKQQEVMKAIQYKFEVRFSGKYLLMLNCVKSKKNAN